MNTNRSVPPWSILDRSHPYVNAASTDLRATFARIRREQYAAAAASEAESNATRARAFPEESAPRIVRKAAAKC